ncbi:quinone-dependent dihydroorotate dehydrogenase [Ferrovum sp.]|uniref:quinone-dependent dihydroorotate dehydrogenase n=1 Tax=Ferrovum sp. TaxID=2609467 RepID=UPI00262E662C|nr:quinone-dependent dihydroorotate dehydrogenase [Ferrovum sp.]
MLYPIARSLLFRLDPETAHILSLTALDRAARCGLVQPGHLVATRPRTVMGLTFANPLGIAAGLDKNGAYLRGLAALGVGFIEVGTVTPRPQSGNPRPRVFRLPAVAGLINRLGFNNHGVAALVEQVRQWRPSALLGINIGKNFDTPLEHAVEDYRSALSAVAPHADYVTVNISSPNTQNLRQLQGTEALPPLLRALHEERLRWVERLGRPLPIAIKIAPDLTPAALTDIAQILVEERMDAVIATNTTITRASVLHLPHGQETGGLSGSPLHEQSLAVVAHLAHVLDGALPIIGVGGITSAARAQAMLAAGAQLVQVYTGLIYRGPDLIREILESDRPT